MTSAYRWLEDALDTMQDDTPGCPQGQCSVTSEGAMLADPACLGKLPGATAAGARIFEPAFWQARGQLRVVQRGRGSAWFVAGAEVDWVLRHCRRGGWIAAVSRDLYVWCGARRVRAFAEWRLLACLARQGLPVPIPIAARYQRRGLFYRCDLITQRIARATPLSGRLAAGALRKEAWAGIGATLALFHAAGADHADLNAHNILLDEAGTVSLIDFDRGRLRPPGAWTAGNLSRLRRSLRKVARGLPPDRFPPDAWRCLLDGYASARSV